MNFDSARENMIKQQVLTEGIDVNNDFIQAMISIPREKFLPSEYKTLAYCDTNLLIGGREIKSPMLTAKILNALNVKSTDNVLKLGIESGYTAAILAKISKSLEVLDYSEDKLSAVKRQINSLGIDIDNASFSITEHLNEIINSSKKYNCIYISNIIIKEEIDQSLLNLLEINGRIIFIARNDSFDKAFIVKKTGNETYQKELLFDIYNK